MFYVNALAFEEVRDKDFPPGYFYAHLPRLGLTTHGLGLEGARQAALDLASVWLAKKKPRVIHRRRQMGLTKWCLWLRDDSQS
jgi:hypothetical protein